MIIDLSGDEQIPANRNLLVWRSQNHKLNQPPIDIQNPFEVRYLNPQNISWEGFHGFIYNYNPLVSPSFSIVIFNRTNCVTNRRFIPRQLSTTFNDAAPWRWVWGKRHPPGNHPHLGVHPEPGWWRWWWKLWEYPPCSHGGTTPEERWVTTVTVNCGDLYSLSFIYRGGWTNPFEKICSS